ncbi:S-methyl-5-thioribose-1-phosphate isomerase [Oceanobacter mangrovi]|uniref:S-methyl-5-thioribose-1-phosphate isomerase n=1 Tax=Oceanobacter mangrovi TaxID=2862510 RepID=UPI001C8E1286|nr:S-methyl-5-thioribose-1-phosphate isomerase [Oceanobacter mangrovi]
MSSSTPHAPSSAGHSTGVVAIEWRQQSLFLLDQRVLPHQHQMIECRTAAETADAIRDMVVRGAPAIGISAAYGFALDALAGRDLQAAYKVLAESRPTAVNLFWALERMASLNTSDGQALLAEARRIHEEDIQANLAMGQFGASLISDGVQVYTHCNTGALATGGHGTALGIIRSAFADGKIQHVYAGETRPWLQGARLTAWELMQDNIPVSLVCDGAAAQLFRAEKPEWVIVGADRITANGDVANKIGTYSLAVHARHHGMKFMVAAPTTTFDLSLPSGNAIPIEQRPMHEVTSIQGVQVAPEGCHAINPSFDVTPAELIDAIVTERGIIRNPSTEAVAALFAAN